MSNLPVPQFGEFGVYMHNKKRKLQEQNKAVSVKSRLFESLCFHINGDTHPPLRELRQLILEHGGTYEQYDLHKVDIILAESLSTAKRQTWHNKTVLRPSFVTDSIQEETLMEQFRYNLTSSKHFIESFFQQSRLHYLSAWKAELRKWCKDHKRSSTRPLNVTILHVDMDAFFVSASLLNAPQHIDSPVVVSHGGGQESSADVASCNYKAREYGIKNGMSLRRAQSLCTTLVVLPYAFDQYKRLSKALYDILLTHCDEIEAVSCDEAYIDVTHQAQQLVELATIIRSKVHDATSITCSIGIGTSKLLARIATNEAKPNGVYSLSPDQVGPLIAKQRPSFLPGIGYKMNKSLSDHDIHTCADLMDKSVEWLQSILGPSKGLQLYHMVRGQDDRQLNDQSQDRQSVSAEVNWGIRFQQSSQFIEFLHELTKQVLQRLHDEGCKTAKCVLKLMVRRPDQPVEPPKHMGHGICNKLSFSVQYPPTNSFDLLWPHVHRLGRKYTQPPSDLRGIGIQLLQLTPIKDTVAKVDDAFFEDISQSFYDALPSSVQEDVYQDWRRRKNQHGLKEKLEEAKGKQQMPSFPPFMGLHTSKDVLKLIKEWTKTSPHSETDMRDLEGYMDTLLHYGYGDLLEEISYALQGLEWPKWFQSAIDDIPRKLLQRYQ